MLEFTEKQELSGLNNDNLTFENTTNINKSMFGEQLLNGMGDNIISYIKNPPKPKKTKVVLFKLKNFINRIFEVL